MDTKPRRSESDQEGDPPDDAIDDFIQSAQREYFLTVGYPGLLERLQQRDNTPSLED